MKSQNIILEAFHIMEKIPWTVIVAIVSLYGNIVVYVYELGLCTRFSIPYWMISVSVIDLLSVAVIAVVVVVYFLILYWYIRFLLLFLYRGSVGPFLKLLLKFVPGKIKDFMYSLSSKCWHFRKGISFQGFPRHNFVPLAIVTTLAGIGYAFMAGVSGYNGISLLSNQPQYFINDECVIIAEFGDRIVAAGYDQKTGTVFHEFAIYSLDKLPRVKGLDRFLIPKKAYGFYNHENRRRSFACPVENK